MNRTKCDTGAAKCKMLNKALLSPGSVFASVAGCYGFDPQFSHTQDFKIDSYCILVLECRMFVRGTDWAKKPSLVCRTSIKRRDYWINKPLTISRHEMH